MLRVHHASVLFCAGENESPYKAFFLEEEALLRSLWSDQLNVPAMSKDALKTCPVLFFPEKRDPKQFEVSSAFDM